MLLMHSLIAKKYICQHEYKTINKRYLSMVIVSTYNHTIW